MGIGRELFAGLLLGFAVGQAGHAQAVGESSVALEEVEVIGNKLYQLQRKLVEAQDRFYLRYNELNASDDFDIHCTMRAPTGTNIRRRECHVEFLEKAAAQEGQSYLVSLTSGLSAPARPAPSTPTAWFERRDEYHQAVKALLESNPELRALALNWQQLQGRYDRARKERFKDHLILFE